MNTDETTATLTPITGTWKTRCCVCGAIYENGVGSTPCCGAMQEIIEQQPTPPPAASATLRTQTLLDSCEVYDHSAFVKLALLARQLETELTATTAERDTLHEKACVLQSQVDNADVNLEQVRLSLKGMWQAKVESAESRITELTAERDAARAERDAWEEHYEAGIVLDDLALDHPDHAAAIQRVIKAYNKLVELKGGENWLAAREARDAAEWAKRENDERVSEVAQLRAERDAARAERDEAMKYANGLAESLGIASRFNSEMREMLKFAHDAMLNWFSSEYAANPKTQRITEFLSKVKPVPTGPSDLSAQLTAALARVAELEADKRAMQCNFDLGNSVMNWLLKTEAYMIDPPEGETGGEAVMRLLNMAVELHAACSPLAQLGKPSDDRPSFHDLPNDVVLFENSGDVITVENIRNIQAAIAQ